ncbi:MAG: hypothetical protein FD180_2656 [Planctomycetota bacterium]|nr:MAG: hypothetical protein FD180_2656 [Planctomycetota bacterium]
MRLKLLIALLLVAGCATEKEPDSSEPVKPAARGPAQRLADPDPSVSAAAREELLALDDLAAPRLRADAENPANAAVRETLLEIVDVLEEKTLAVAREWLLLTRSGHLALESLKESSPSPRSVFLCWLTRPEEVAKGDESRFALRADDVRALGMLWLRGYTLADIGADAAAWRAFLDLHSDCSVTQLRLQGLKQRGYSVLGADANEVAREFLRAGNGSFLGERISSWGLRMQAGNLACDAFLMLLPEVFAFSASGDRSPSGLLPALEWIAINSGHFVWEQNRLTSNAGAEVFLTIYEGDNASHRLAALSELRRWPDRIPKDAWKLFNSAPSLVAHAMHRAGVPAPREALPLVLTALGDVNDPADLASIWNAGDLESLALDGEAESATRARAIRVLAAVYGDLGFTVCTSLLKPEQDRRVTNAAILALARLPGNAGLEMAEKWLDSAADGPDRIDIAIALARRGRRAGFDVILKRARGDLLDRRRAAMVREFVEGVPEADNDDRWAAWASGVGNYAWDAERRKWTAE